MTEDPRMDSALQRQSSFCSTLPLHIIKKGAAVQILGVIGFEVLQGSIHLPTSLPAFVTGIHVSHEWILTSVSLIHTHPGINSDPKAVGNPVLGTIFFRR